jgi:hypothetical protein
MNNSSLASWIGLQTTAKTCFIGPLSDTIYFDDIKGYRTVKTFVPEADSTLPTRGFSVPEFTIEPTKEKITEGRIQTIVPWIERVKRNV